MESCTVNGIDIPKGMLVQANVWSVHYNQEHWVEDTQRFIPERYACVLYNGRQLFLILIVFENTIQRTKKKRRNICVCVF